MKRVFLFLCLVVLVCGCQSQRLELIPAPNRDVIALSADDVVSIMRHAGFTDEEILDLGTSLRNNLAQHGAARLKRGQQVEAIFTVFSPYVYVSTRDSGHFTYDTQTGEVK